MGVYPQKPNPPHDAGLSAPEDEIVAGEDEEGGAGETTTSRQMGGSLEELWGCLPTNPPGGLACWAHVVGRCCRELAAVERTWHI